ncbi:MAG TPA: hypothetical protein PKU78_05940 [Candidatus Dojkabacteria bacterium]|nr:hypothetical protein [Candidatus Dojkabacteria bacterium]HRO65736.1 hypothetical protein [Candidatus Dojkabacteria bacterium]HRP37096.1 hypothetical protein [Candidatus Dojkabacteria bacterium]HRP51079.1 hypothetical protein [Candidatus Dojkabacteria bacterium]
MRFLFSLSLSILFSVLFFTVGVNALTAELVSEQDNTKVYNILAEPTQDSSAVQFRVKVDGGTIIDVAYSDDVNLSYIPVCDNNESYFEQNICIEIAAKKDLIQTDQVLLKVTVETQPGIEPVFSANPDHAYLTINGDLINESGVVLESYSINTLEELPEPIIEEEVVNESNSLPFVLLIGILVVLVGAFLVIIFFSSKEPKDQIN